MTIESESNLDNLPDDVLALIFRRLELKDLIGLKCVARGIAERVDGLGIPLYLSLHRQSHCTASPPIHQWAPLDIVRYNHRINRSLASHTLHALQIVPEWPQSVIPALEITEDQLVLGVGSKILIHPLVHSSSGKSRAGCGNSSGSGGKVIDRSIEYVIEDRTKKYQGGKSDIVGIVPISSIKNDFIVAQFDGTIQRVALPQLVHDDHNIEADNRDRNTSQANISPRMKARYSSDFSLGHGRISTQGHRESINTLVGTDDGARFMSTSISGKVDIYSTHSPWVEPTSFQLKSRAWSSLLSPTNALLGIQGSIQLYPICPTGAVLEDHKRKLIGPETPLLSSPYSLHLPTSSTSIPTSSSTSGQSSHNPNILLSGWYDSHIRLHDLRSSSPLPTTQFVDPYTWSDNSAYYSTTYIGEHHIAGGNSKHGTVSFFDLRNPTSSLNYSNPTNDQNQGQGHRGNSSSNWSCFSPGGKGSPVYALKSDNGILYGTTERRLFCLTFNGQGSHKNDLITSNLENAMKESYYLRKNKNKNGRYVPNGYKGRGGKWTWTVKYDNDHDELGGMREYKGARGYEHRSRYIDLFDSLEPV
ncbi:uncharacterized protein I303_103973 [Kwoniella dejecticola CBS 10117]|uniref:F-box domain-containing protein n=1 Tax=Kwoniella dejecticola CBS 10117 TaxID=1296121 RepID=A0A1A6A891_9TREE|nr:uncharacterized protein I303_03990 [Kwoniella dejecticola CBS 10117]OBR86268.1 hypothetical protein I303_03990 [Kwoniella dejecticola CBS 10117]